MKLFRRILVSALVAALYIPALTASSPNLPVVEILGQQYYVYKVKKGDSLFGIARQFDWDDAVLQKLNADVLGDMQKGANIYYPVESEAKVRTPVKAAPEHLDRSPLKHLVKKGETVYSISRTYGIPVETIYKLNPASKHGIKAGEELTLQSVRDALEDDQFYTVKSGDTMYALARKGGFTVASLLELNPGMSEKNFQAGSVIKLPKKGAGVEQKVEKITEENLAGFESHKVEKDETWSSIARKEGVSVDRLKDANPGAEKPKKNQIISVPVISKDTVERVVDKFDPRELSKEGVKDIYEDVHGITPVDSARFVKMAVVLSDPDSNKDLEFMRGMLTAVDRLKCADFKIDLVAIEGNRQQADVVAAIKKANPTVIVSTADKNLPSYLVDYSTTTRTPFVNTFDIRSEAYEDNPYLVQLLTPSNYFNDAIALHVRDTYPDYQLVMGPVDDNDQLAGALRAIWPQERLLANQTAELFTARPLKDNDKIIVYGYPVKKQEVADMLKIISDKKNENPLAEILVLGRPNWVVFDESLSEPLHELNVMIPSRFYFDKDSDAGKRFLMYYKSLFDRQPVRSIPLYAGMGYDTATYFLSQMANTGGELNAFKPTDGGVQSDFDLVRQSNWGGMLNPVVYMLRFTPYDTIEKTIVK